MISETQDIDRLGQLGTCGVALDDDDPVVQAERLDERRRPGDRPLSFVSIAYTRCAPASTEALASTAVGGPVPRSSTTLAGDPAPPRSSPRDMRHSGARRGSSRSTGARHRRRTRRATARAPGGSGGGTTCATRRGRPRSSSVATTAHFHATDSLRAKARPSTLARLDAEASQLESGRRSARRTRSRPSTPVAREVAGAVEAWRRTDRREKRVRNKSLGGQRRLTDVPAKRTQSPPGVEARRERRSAVGSSPDRGRRPACCRPGSR